jgi:hypothetical protein
MHMFKFLSDTNQLGMAPYGSTSSPTSRRFAPHEGPRSSAAANFKSKKIWR